MNTTTKNTNVRMENNIVHKPIRKNGKKKILLVRIKLMLKKNYNKHNTAMEIFLIAQMY